MLYEAPPINKKRERERKPSVFGTAVTIWKNNGEATGGKSIVKKVFMGPANIFFNKSHRSFLTATAGTQVRSQKITFFLPIFSKNSFVKRHHYMVQHRVTLQNRTKPKVTHTSEYHFIESGNAEFIWISLIKFSHI